MRNDSLAKYKNNLRIFSIIIIVICLIMTTITIVGMYKSPVQSEMEDSIKNIVINEEIKLDKTPEIKQQKSSGVIWTTRNDCGDSQQNVNQYCTGEEVYINGENFEPNSTLYWDITVVSSDIYPSGFIINESEITSYSDGSICFYAYNVTKNDSGVYKANVENKTDNFNVNGAGCPIDNDDDGYDSDEDCDDNDASVYPGAPELCDGKDNDCDGIIPYDEYDDDKDGWMICEGDCNDSDSSINPDAVEICDGVDNNCDGLIDEGFVDTDDDGIADCVDTDDDDDGVPDGEDCAPLDDSLWQLISGYVDNDGDDYGAGDLVEICSGDSLPDGYVDNDLDCDDSNASINPGAEEICGDGVDNDCDGYFDEGITYYQDGDGDDFGNSDFPMDSCEPLEGYVDNDLDCDDSDSSINPDAVEICDGVDNNCDGLIDEGFVDTDDDGIADCVDTDDDDDGAPDGEDCAPLDDSLWQLISGYVDNDGDDYGAGDLVEICSGDSLPDGYVDNDLDCDDSNASINPGAEEICGDGVDNDCDGYFDEGITYYQDGDGDDFGNSDFPMDYCEPLEGYVDNDLDCDDSDSSINPDAVEICDGVDNNCDGLIDEGFVDTDDDGIADCVDTDDDDDGVPDGEDCAPLDDSLWQLISGYVDNDGDDYGAGDLVEICSGDSLPDGYVDNDLDCDDSNASINPGAEEICGDGVDNDCDDLIDEGITYYQDSDGDTFGNPDVSMDYCEPLEGYVDNDLDCDDSNSSIYPGAEEIPYDGIDQDCDGFDLTDVDGDGQNSTEVGGTDCDDNDDSIYLGAPELCDEKDNDCDGTIDEGCGGGGSSGGSNGGTGGDTNSPPIAIAEANPETGFIQEVISFDGSDSYDDGEIVNYTWDFKDGTKGYGVTTTHIFTNIKLYQVKLTVTDDGGLSNSTIVNVSIITANNPPSDLIVSGPTYGHQNAAYTFNTTVIDPDENDSIRYNFEWGDGEENTSNDMNSGIKYQIRHGWTTYGIYEIEVYAEDESNARSETKTLTIYIDVHPIDDEIKGYLFDENSDGTFDGFLNYATGNETIVQKQNDGTYLIDSDGDGNWDYIYDIETNTLTKYEQDYTSICLLGLLALILLILLLILAKRDKDKKKKEEENKKKQAALAANKKQKSKNTKKNNSVKKKTAAKKKTGKK